MYFSLSGHCKPKLIWIVYPENYPDAASSILKNPLRLPFNFPMSKALKYHLPQDHSSSNLFWTLVLSSKFSKNFLAFLLITHPTLQTLPVVFWFSSDLLDLPFLIGNDKLHKSPQQNFLSTSSSLPLRFETHWARYSNVFGCFCRWNNCQPQLPQRVVCKNRA